MDIDNSDLDAVYRTDGEVLVGSKPGLSVFLLCNSWQVNNTGKDFSSFPLLNQ